MRLIKCLLVVAIILGVNGTVRADHHLWRIDELYSNADGTVQYTTSFGVLWGLSTDTPLRRRRQSGPDGVPSVHRRLAVLRSGTGYTTSFGVSWGLSTDIPVPSDHDGDGKIDPAVWRASTGGWHILKSSTSYTTSLSLSWGLSGCPSARPLRQRRQDRPGGVASVHWRLAHSQVEHELHDVDQRVVGVEHRYTDSEEAVRALYFGSGKGDWTPAGNGYRSTLSTIDTRS